MVLAVLVLGLPKKEQRQALRYGIVGAFAFRAVATLAAAYLIQLGWVKLVGGAFIIIAWVGLKLLIEYLHGAGYIGFEAPKWLSLGLIVVIFAIAFLYARRQERKTRSRAERAARELFADEGTPR